ncbi:MAG: hypothetical protein WBD10_06565 [Acidobacteriaceae bacterium]
MATRPVEDIEAVLGRFQAWAGTRNAAEAGSGIREIPYDEALASGRYRWKGGGANTAKKTGAKTGAVPEPLKAAPPLAKVEPDKKQRAAKSVRGREHAKVRDRGTAARESKASAGGGVRADCKNGRGGNHCAAKPPASRGDASAKPEFRETLAAAVRPAEVVVAPPAALTRQAAISIRLAPSERTLIQTRAAEAGITPSAYIRQCALEVEQLRAQVKAAVALMGNGSAFPAIASLTPAAAPSFPASASQTRVCAPGFFARVRSRLFPSRVPTLALRA